MDFHLYSVADHGKFLRAHHWVRNPRISLVCSDLGALCGITSLLDEGSWDKTMLRFEPRVCSDKQEAGMINPAQAG